MDFTEVTENTSEFILLRHDVEFSVERAWKLSIIETKFGVNASYFVQITNNAYNVLSKQHLDMLIDMEKRGHHIGLHYHVNGETNIQRIQKGIITQAKILSEVSGLKIDRYSVHRPSKDVLRANLKIEGLINAYDRQFFSFVEEVLPNTVLDVKYIADSMHHWNYGVPTPELFKDHKKVQLLIHPYSWTPNGYDNLHNFKSLIQEKQSELIETIDLECKHFNTIKELL